MKYAKVCRPPIQIYHDEKNRFNIMQCLYNVYITKHDVLDCITICFVLACIGRLCTPKCPRGYHRHQCIKICTCDADECGDESGCITTGKWMHTLCPFSTF